MFREFNQTAIELDAEEKPDSLIEMFEEADLYCYKEFASLLKNWSTEIINSFARPYGNTNQSNALAESINQKRIFLKVSKGCTNFEHFRVRTLYCLNDHMFYGLTRKSKNKKSRRS